MKYALILVSFLMPALSQAITCEAVNAYVTDSSTVYPWKTFKNVTESEKMFNASTSEGSCNYMVVYSTANGDTYYLSIADSETGAQISTLAAFDAKGKLQVNLNKPNIGTFCGLRCSK